MDMQFGNKTITVPLFVFIYNLKFSIQKIKKDLLKHLTLTNNTHM